MDGEEGSLTAELLRNKTFRVYNGKVKNVYMNDNYGLLLLKYSDALSCFDKYRCHVLDKGRILNETNAWWMEKTRHIVPNHYIAHSGNELLVKKCERVDIEVIVRAYYTGSLTKEGNAEKYGICIPEGMKDGDKFPEPIITPTTKDEHDLPLTEKEIMEKGLSSPLQWEEIKKTALQLFRYGESVAEKRGLILVDTKYEFGYDRQGRLTLIDELHTGDSSRYWAGETNYDKDHVRRFVKENPVAVIPQDVIQKTRQAYLDLYSMLTGNSFEMLYKDDTDVFEQFLVQKPKVVVIAGSIKDKEHVFRINMELEKRGLAYLNFFHSAHKETEKVLSIIRSFEGQKIAYVAVAGYSNALGGVVAANSSKVVVNCPPFKGNLDITTNVNSSLMMPSGVPVSLIIRPDNLAHYLSRIFTH